MLDMDLGAEFSGVRETIALGDGPGWQELATKGLFKCLTGEQKPFLEQIHERAS
jgi:hypothetical protein